MQGIDVSVLMLKCIVGLLSLLTGVVSWFGVAVVKKIDGFTKFSAKQEAINEDGEKEHIEIKKVLGDHSKTLAEHQERIGSIETRCEERSNHAKI